MMRSVVMNMLTGFCRFNELRFILLSMIKTEPENSVGDQPRVVRLKVSGFIFSALPRHCTKSPINTIPKKTIN